MPRPAEQYEAMRAKTEERIRAAAVSLFARHGFAATGIRDVARAAGISTGLVYRHHASKEDLFDALVAEAAEGLRAVVDRLRDGDALRDVTREVVAAIARDDRFAEFLLLMNQAFAVPEPPSRRRGTGSCSTSSPGSGPATGTRGSAASPISPRCPASPRCGSRRATRSRCPILG